MRRFFETSASAKKSDLVDIIKKEYTECRTETILEEMYLQKKEEKAERQQCSHWKEAYSSTGFRREWYRRKWIYSNWSILGEDDLWKQNYERDTVNKIWDYKKKPMSIYI